MKIRAKLPIALVAALVTAGLCWNSCQNAGVSPQSTTIVYSDSLFREDSVRMERLFDQFFVYINTAKYDSIGLCAKHIVELGDTILQYRQDSAIYMMWAYSHAGTSNYYSFQGEHEKADEMVLKAKELITKRFGDYHPMAINLNIWMATGLESAGDYEEAAKYYNKALHETEVIYGDKPNGSYQSIYHYMSAGMLRQGNLDMAIYYRRKRVESIEKFQAPQSLSRPYLSLAELYVQKDTLPPVLECLEKAIRYEPLAHERSRPHIRQMVLWMEGEALRMQGQYAGVRQKIQASIDTAMRHGGENREVILAYAALGNFAAQTGDTTAAIRYYKQALAAAGRVYGPEYWDESAMVYERFGRLLLQAGHLEEAFKVSQQQLHMLCIGKPDTADLFYYPAVQEILPEAQTYQIFTREGDILWQLYQQSRDVKYLNLALHNTELAFQLLESFHKRLSGEITRSRMTANYIPIAENGIKTSLQLYALKKDPVYLHKALAFMENSKALILRESMQEVAARSRLQLPAEVLKQEHDLSRDVWAQGQLIQVVSRQEPVDSARLLSMYNRLLGFKQKYDRFQKAMRQNYPGYSQLNYGLDTVSLTDVQKKLPDDQTLLLEYFQGKDHITLMAISKNNARNYSLALDSALFRAVRALRLMVNHPDNEHTNAEVVLFSNAAHLLYTRLLDAALKDAGNMNHLIVIPDGELATLPFHLLLTEPAPGNSSYRNLPYALRRYSFQYEFSAATLGVRGSKKAAARLYAGFAPAYETGPVVTRSTPDSAIYASLFPEARGGRIPGLRYNQPEVAEASQLFRGDQYTGSTASESTFKREAAQYRILHMALHACTDDVNPAYSQLIFSNPSPADTAEDGVLHAYELYNLDLRSDLAVLSACRSGGGRISRGEGVMSLSWAFKRAGCPNVVMSVWNADDLSAKTIIGAFFQQLARGRSKADALQRAQLDFLDNAEPRHCHPYYWAPFSLIGDNLPLEAPSSSTLLMFFALAALAVLGLLIYLWLKNKNTARLQ